MSIESIADNNSLENIQINSFFQLTINTQALCIEDDSFQKEDIIQIISIKDKKNDI